VRERAENIRKRRTPVPSRTALLAKCADQGSEDINVLSIQEGGHESQNDLLLRFFVDEFE
jgi:hypothetical protein